MAATAVIMARPANPAAPPVAWQKIPDLVPVIRARSGAPPYTQALILRWLLEKGAARNPVDMPPIATVARAVDVSRQSANQAWHTLQKRGIVTVEPIEDDRGWSRVTVKLPANQQLSLFRAK